MVVRSKVTSGATASNSIQRFRDYWRRGPLGEDSKLPVCMRGEGGWSPSLRRQTGCNPRSYRYALVGFVVTTRPPRPSLYFSWIRKRFSVQRACEIVRPRSGFSKTVYVPCKDDINKVLMYVTEMEGAHPVTTYRAESSTLNEYIAKRLEAFEWKCLRRMFAGIKINEIWRKWYNKGLLQLCGDLDILSFFRINMLIWICHVNRKGSNRRVSQVFNNNCQVSGLTGRSKTDGGTVNKQVQ